MIVVRGVNVYPSAVEEIIRANGSIAEFRAYLNQSSALTRLRIEIEPLPEVADAPAMARHLETVFESALALRVPVTVAAPGTLPAFRNESPPMGPGVNRAIILTPLF